jgi:hypothetical protein
MCNAIVSFGNRKKSHGVKSGEQGGWEWPSFCLSQKFTHRQSRVSKVYCHSGETNHPIFTFQVVFITHFLADTVTRQFSDSGLQFFLVEQIHNAQLH